MAKSLALIDATWRPGTGDLWRFCRFVMLGMALLGAAQARCSNAAPIETSRARGQTVVTRAACASCHEIPGILENSAETGPPLAHFSQRRVIAGILPNSVDNLVYWLRFPQRVVPGNSMPNSGLSESEARDAAAYLESLE